MHVPPKRFMRLRHYGLLCSRSKKKHLILCRNLLGCQKYLSRLRGKEIPEILKQLFKIDITKCSVCGGMLGRPQKISPLLCWNTRISYFLKISANRFYCYAKKRKSKRYSGFFEKKLYHFFERASDKKSIVPTKGRWLCSIRSNRKWDKRRGSSLQSQNCLFVYLIIDSNLPNLTMLFVVCFILSHDSIITLSYGDGKKFCPFVKLGNCCKSQNTRMLS